MSENELPEIAAARYVKELGLREARRRVGGARRAATSRLKAAVARRAPPDIVREIDATARRWAHIWAALPRMPRRAQRSTDRLERIELKAPRELLERIDGDRGVGVSRSAWIRHACELLLEQRR